MYSVPQLVTLRIFCLQVMVMLSQMQLSLTDGDLDRAVTTNKTITAHVQGMTTNSKASSEEATAMLIQLQLHHTLLRTLLHLSSGQYMQLIKAPSPSRH